MDGSISRAEHEEFRRRLEEENRRQDKAVDDALARAQEMIKE